MSQYTIINADCRDAMRGLDPCSVDSIVTDPPYGLSFMGKDWDHGVPGEHFWREALRVAKPGAHLLAFGGTRTYHRLACALEDAGWEIRDCIMWVYGSGFPKSHDVSKAIDREAGAERETVCAPVTEAAKQWHGWGTALKPAWEPIIVARKPLCGTAAENVLRYGTGAVNVGGCRVGTEKRWNPIAGNKNLEDRHTVTPIGRHKETDGRQCVGRWPANLIYDGSDEVVGLMPNNAARFFYCAKASKADRETGVAGVGALRDGGRLSEPRKNHHPTVKPTDLMRYLCRLVTPPGGVVLDPFMGSGSTGKAAVLEGFRFIGIDLSDEYVEIARARIAHAQHDGAALFAGAVP